MLSPGGVEQAELAGSPGGLDASVHAELLEDVPDVRADGLGADEQFLGDLPVRQAGSQESQHIGLPIAEAGVVGHSGLR